MDAHLLYVVTTGQQELPQLLDAAAGFEPGLVDALHIREKHRSAREIVSWYHALAEALPATPIYINDRLDAALAVQAPGVQLTGGSLPADTARRLLQPETRIGVSVHSPEEAALAERLGADYVLFGHIYATASKPGMPPRGIEGLRRVIAACRLPVIAIGGIEPDNTSEVLRAGAAGIAVLSGVLLHQDPAGRLRQYRQAMRETPFPTERG